MPRNGTCNVFCEFIGSRKCNVVQLMEQSTLSKTLGDIVIALYVLDLAWVILAGMNSRGENRRSSVRSDSSQK